MSGRPTLAEPNLLPPHPPLAPARQGGDPTAARLAAALHRGRQGLLARQQPDGHWVGELEGDTILESEYIILMAFLGRESDPRVRMAANYIRTKELPEGGWAIYPGGPPEVSVSVKAYFALKIAGEPAGAPHMLRHAEVIRSLGGAERTNSFTRFYLALLGQLSYDYCPTVPPELILLPRWFPVNLYAMSSWSRTIFVPLSIVSAYRPVRELPPEAGVRELFLGPPEALRSPLRPTERRFTWSNFFLRVDRWLKRCERFRLTPLRRRAIRKALAWMRRRFAESDGLGAIFPPMVYTVIVLRCLGVPDDDPEMLWAVKQLEGLMIPEGDTLRLQPCLSPVWDTALVLNALTEARYPGHAPEVARAVRWLVEREVRRRGDWGRNAPGLEPGGWFFEYRNGYYPDTDDTAMVLMALARTGHAWTEDAKPAAARGVNWLLGMQNADGGWAAFDRRADRPLLEKVPFADHNAMLDPSCPDITARALEALAEYGYSVGQPPVDRAVEFIRRAQEPNGSWVGRWGVNYLYGTWQVLLGLRAVGFGMSAEEVRRAAGWLKSVQNPDGGWGESPRSYDDPSFAGVGPSTASQTAWALMGLMAAGEAASPEVRAGVEYLLRTQRPDGGWDEEAFTGTGFPRVFYLRYHMYPLYFPLIALGRYAREMQK